MCLAGCHAVAQIQGYHLAYIWGSLLKFQGVEVGLKFDVFLHFLHYGGGVVPKSMPCARLWFAKFVCLGLSLSFKAQCLRQIEERSVSSWVSCCCTDIGLSSGIYFG